MDKVQIYEACLLSLALVFGIAMDGRHKEASTYKFTETFVALLFGLPVIGRIFLWW
jgi:hypothetical protein